MARPTPRKAGLPKSPMELLPFALELTLPPFSMVRVCDPPLLPTENGVGSWWNRRSPLLPHCPKPLTELAQNRQSDLGKSMR